MNDLCTEMGRPVVQDSGIDEKVELLTHSETILLGDEHAEDLANEILRITDNTTEPDTEER